MCYNGKHLRHSNSRRALGHDTGNVQWVASNIPSMMFARVFQHKIGGHNLAMINLYQPCWLYGQGTLPLWVHLWGMSNLK